MVATVQDDAGAQDTAARVLAHLYRAIYAQGAIIEATNTGAIARAGRATQEELWSAVALLGGDRDSYLAWGALRARVGRDTLSRDRSTPSTG